MLDLRLPEISSTSGSMSDGVSIGNINRTQPVAAYNNLLLSTEIFALRRDTGTSNIFTDLSSEAISEVDNSFLPWGDDATFSSGDEIWIADGEKNINEIYVQITTPGVWTGTGLSVLESIDGDTLVSVGNLVDTSNGMRNAAGVYKISFDINLANRKSIAPYFGATKRKYVVLRPNGLTSKTTSPKLRRIWTTSSEGANEWTDYTSMVTADLTNSDFGSIANNTIFPVIGSESRIGYSGLTIGVYDAIYRGIPNNYTVVREYLASDDTWKPLPDYVDPGNNFTTVSTTYSATPTYLYKKWSIPSDWAAKTLTLPPSTTPITAYWVRRRITAVSTYGPIPIYLYRRRSLSFGAGLATGIYFRNAVNFNYLTYSIGVPSTSATVVAFTNCITGASRSVTIPANSVDSGALSDGRLDFSSALNIGAGEMLLISHISGTGVLQDCEFHLDPQ